MSVDVSWDVRLQEVFFKMADRGRFSDDSDTSDDERRDPGYNPVAVRPSRDRDVVQTYNNNNGADNQLATGSAVHAGDFNGPAQFGRKNTVIHNKTYVTNNYFQTPSHPSHHHGDSSSHHLLCQWQVCLHSSHHGNSLKNTPCHCQKCLDYHDNDHTPLAEHRPPSPRSDPRHSGLPPVPQLSPPSSQQTEQIESTDRKEDDMPRTHKNGASGFTQLFTQLKHKLRGQLSSEAFPSLSDVTHHVTGASQEESSEEKAAVKTKTEKYQPTEAVPMSAETRPGDDPPVSITDSEGQELKPGDAVWITSLGYTIYVDDMDVVGCRKTGGLVKKEKLTMTEPFSKVTITRGRCKLYPPQERVAQAEDWVGKTFTKGDRWLDFMAWICTELPWRQAYSRGFSLQK